MKTSIQGEVRALDITTVVDLHVVSVGANFALIEVDGQRYYIREGDDLKIEGTITLNITK